MNNLIMKDISRDLIEQIVCQVLSAQLGEQVHPNRSVDPSGVIAIRGSDIKTEPFDTGKPGDKVWLKDIYTLEESPRLGAGFMEMDHTTFEWTLNYDEIDYIIEGTLEIIVDGRTTVGHAGDVILIPKGSKIKFSTPSTCRFLYTVYPANWSSQT